MTERHTNHYDQPYDEARDPGSHAAANLRDRMNQPDPASLSNALSPYGRVLAAGPFQCWLCEPGYVCHLCRPT